MAEILICRRHPYVDADGLGATQTRELALLRHAQELGLKFQRHVANLVQKERVPIRHLESSLGLGTRARESASFVAEEFTLQQSTRNRSTVKSHFCQHCPEFRAEPIKFERVISLVLYECSHPAISLASSSLSRDPLAEVWIAIRQRNASRFALRKKSHAILTGQSQLLKVENDAAIFPFGDDERFQLGNVLFVDPAA